jgi:hypothetical protein
MPIHFSDAWYNRLLDKAMQRKTLHLSADRQDVRHLRSWKGSVLSERKRMSHLSWPKARSSREALGLLFFVSINTLPFHEIVFAGRGDLSLLGARPLEGLNLAVDAGGRRLVGAGPIPAA